MRLGPDALLVLLAARLARHHALGQRDQALRGAPLHEGLPARELVHELARELALRDLLELPDLELERLRAVHILVALALLEEVLQRRESLGA